MQKRIYWLDAAKFIGILLVIIDHMAISGANRAIIILFHMPLFFWIHGFTYKYGRSIKDIINCGIKTQIVPYIAGGMISIVMCCYLKKRIFVEWLGLIENTDNFSNIFYMFKTWDGWSLYWFFPCFFIANIFFYGFLHLVKGKTMVYSILLAFILNFFGVCFSYISYFRINEALVALLFMYAGYIYSNKLIKCTKKGIILYEVVCGALYLLFAYKKIGINMAQHSYPYYPLCIFATLGGIYIFILLVRKIPENKIISFFGKNTLTIYFVHSIEHNFFPWGRIKELAAGARGGG